MLEEGYDEEEVVIDYDQRKLSTLRVICVCTGTVFRSRNLMMEQAAIVVAFWTTFFMSDEAWFPCFQVDSLVHLVQVISTLAVFLLGFYTSNSLMRWWRLRTDGIGNIWGACSELNMLISQAVTRDQQVLSSIRRYARASLMLQFMKHRKQLAHLDLLTERKVLTSEEVLCLMAYKNNLSESMWTWITNIVMNLHKQGLIQSEYMLCLILQSVKKGRSGAALIGAQMGTPLPAQYVHILGLMVKLFNLFAAFAYAVKVGCMRTQYITHFLLTFFPPLLYNSVLIINYKLSKPFEEHVLAFPMARYDRGIERDGRSYVQAGQHVPEWIHVNAAVQGVPVVSPRVQCV